MEPHSFVATRVVTLGDLLREVAPILLQAVVGVQVRFLSAVGDRREVADSEVDTCCLDSGCIECLDFVFADGVKFHCFFNLL